MYMYIDRSTHLRHWANNSGNKQVVSVAVSSYAMQSIDNSRPTQYTPGRLDPGRVRAVQLSCMTTSVYEHCWLSSSSSHGGTYSSWALPCPPLIARSPDWLPSSMQTRGQYSVALNPPQLHVDRYDWVFLSVASSPMEAFGLLVRLNGDDLHLVNCRLLALRIA